MTTRRTEDREIDGILFRFQAVPFDKGLTLGLTLAKKIGPVLKALPQGKGEAFPFFEALADVIPTLSQGELLSWTSDLATDCAYSVDGGDKWPLLSKPNRDALFQGRLMLWGKWLLASIEFNFADFFAAFKAPSESGLGGVIPG